MESPWAEKNAGLGRERDAEVERLREENAELILL